MAAPTVELNVGGDLTIQSRQDTSTYRASSSSSGGSLSVSPTGVPTGGSVGGGSSKVNSDYASVTETSGILAGDGGFDVNVQGNTDLNGGVIASTEQAVTQGNNHFETGGTFTTSDIENHANYDASGWSLSASYSAEQTDKRGQPIAATPGGSAGIGSDSGSASSVTTAGISGIAGDASVRSTDRPNGIDNPFDKDRVEREVNAQITITADFGKQASKAVGDYVTKKYNELKDTDPEEAAKWAEGGMYRVLAHAVIGGLTGGVTGAAGAGTASLSADYISSVTADLPEAVRNGVGAAIAAGLGAVVGGYGGAAAAFNADVNNRQLHASEKELAKRLAARSGGRFTVEQIEEQMRLMGNVAFGELPNTLTVLTDSQSVQDSITNDPGMPKTSDGRTVIEVPGQYNAELQQYIIANTQMNAGWIPGSSPYSPSSASTHPSNSAGKASDAETSRCANGDLACLSGTGAGGQQNKPLTPEQQQAIGQYFGQVATDYQRAAALAAATGNAPLVLAFEIAAAIAGVLEQMFSPSLGKVLLDSGLDAVVDAVSKRTGLPRALVFEVMEREIKPRVEVIKKSIDQRMKQ